MNTPAKVAALIVIFIIAGVRDWRWHHRLSVPHREYTAALRTFRTATVYQP
jgi:hypothetical protein